MPPSSRLAYIDWLRGLACVLMFQTHCYDAWLGGAARDSRFAMWSHLLGTFPAPLFLLLSGISVAIVIDKLIQKGFSARQIGRRIVFRGAQILGLGLLFRVQEFAISWKWAPWTDLFRVDILNTIGVSIMLMGAMCWCVLYLPSAQKRRPSSAERFGAPVASPAPEERLRVAQRFSRGGAVRNEGSPVGTAAHNTTTFNSRAPLVSMSIAAAAATSALTPMLWTTWRPRFLPWQVETYINGVHNLNAPQAWLFPIFPWAAFAFAGLAIGFVLMSDFARRWGAWMFLIAGVCGVVLINVAKFADSHGWQVYPVYDYWHTSPSFFAARVGFLLLFVPAAYAWCRWGAGQWGFSPLIQLGTTSLLVYWVHIEFVYGRLHILPPGSQTIAGSSEGLLAIFVAMLILSLLRRAWKDRGAEWLANVGKSPRTAGSALR